MEEQLYGFYVDHTFYSEKDIGKIFNSNVKSKWEKDNVFVIATCQRLELYSTQNENYLAQSYHLPFKSITGWQNCLHRIIRIACGLESVIKGEQHIYLQIQKVHDEISSKNFRSLLHFALQVAGSVRKKYSFIAELGYEDLAIQLLRQKTPAIDIVIFGSGMLGKRLTQNNNIREFYHRIFCVTRNKNFAEDKRILMKNIDEIDIQTTFHCIIATTNSDTKYHDKIVTIINQENCTGIFDLSAVPIEESALEKSPYFSDMYSKDYHKSVQETNAFLEPKINLVEVALESEIEFSKTHF